MMMLRRRLRYVTRELNGKVNRNLYLCYEKVEIYVLHLKDRLERGLSKAGWMDVE